MKFEYIIEQLLVEAVSPEEIQKKYYGDIPFDVFVQICAGDPQSVIRDGNLVKIGKYSKLLLHLFRIKKLRLEDLPRAKEYLGYVYKHNVTLDLNKIKSLNDIYELIKQYIAKGAAGDLNKIISVLSPDEYKLLHNGENWLIYTPSTERAACYLGVDTEWCTIWGRFSLSKDATDRENRFEYYSKKSPLYIIINKKNNSEKYQFHFDSEQFMDKSDAPIKTKEFLNKHPEIKHFFFPSFVKDVTPDELRRELSMSSVLSPEDVSQILKRAMDNGVENKLVLAFTNGDVDGVNEFIDDKNLVDLDIKSGVIELWVKRIGYDTLESVNSTLSYYESDSYNGSENVWNDINEREWNWEEELEPSFISYYKKNDSDIRQYFSIPNYEVFKKQYFDNFMNNEKIRDEFLSTLSNLSTESYEEKAKEYADEIKKYIDIDSGYSSYSLMVNKTEFVIYLLQKNIMKIDDIVEVLDGYLEHNNVQREYEGIYDYDVKPVEYGLEGCDRFTNEIDEYFDNLKDDADMNVKCIEDRELLNTIIRNVFKNSTVFENKHVKIELPSLNINCEDSTIYIKYFNKDTNEKYEGNVKIESLSSYALNYKLFENYVRFKKII